jgi:hypothetical protein
MSNIAYINNDLREIADNLPASYATRWSPTRKAAVVRAVETGVIGLEKALALYRLSLGEFVSWQKNYAARGVRGLSAKRLQVSA